ncbi:MAG: protein phosphatase CheZ [Proteobacteria bacterium]|nr:protein phosphatase CheZ [Pseudomonadota bacterium]
MSNESHALTTRPPSAPQAEADYDAISAAVMETARGRWFLAEYARRNRSADTAQVLAAVERLEQTLRADSQSETVTRLRTHLLDMAKAIAHTKKEVAAIRSDDESHGNLADATGELDAIVKATEKATSVILAAAEKVQEIAWTMREQGIDTDICDQIDGRATDIYSACSFQDLTGQRIGKVVGAMRDLERRIHAMIEIWGIAADVDVHAEGDRTAAPPPAAPAQAAAALNQSDVDDVMSVAGGGAPATSANHGAAARAPASAADAAAVADTRQSEPNAGPPAIEPAAGPGDTGAVGAIDTDEAAHPGASLAGESDAPLDAHAGAEMAANLAAEPDASIDAAVAAPVDIAVPADGDPGAAAPSVAPSTLVAATAPDATPETAPAVAEVTAQAAPPLSDPAAMPSAAPTAAKGPRAVAAQAIASAAANLVARVQRDGTPGAGGTRAQPLAALEALSDEEKTAVFT